MDPIHTRPDAPTVSGLQHDLQTVYGRFLHGIHTAPDTATETAFTTAAREVAGLLWPGAAA